MLQSQLLFKIWRVKTNCCELWKKYL